MPQIPDAFASFVRRYPLEAHRAKSILLTPSDTLGYVYFLQSGRVSLFDVTPRGDEIVLLPLEHNYVFPIHCLLTDMENTNFYKCETQAYVRKVPMHDMRVFLANDLDAQRYLLSFLNYVANALLRRMLHMASASATERLLYELVIESELFGDADTDGSCIVRIRNNCLARRTGLKPETISRELQKLRKLGIIHNHRDGFRLRDVQKTVAALGIARPYSFRDVEQSVLGQENSLLKPQASAPLGAKELCGRSGACDENCRCLCAAILLYTGCLQTP